MIFCGIGNLASTLVTRKCTGYKTTKVVSYLCWKSDQIISKQATAAFGISTIALGVENANLRTEVEDLKTTTSLPSTSTPDKMSKYRLPTAVRPLVYDLFLYPNLTTGLFTGKVKVDVQVLSNTDRIILNSNSLTINKVQIDSVVGSYCLDPTHELLTISKADEAGFKIGNATIEIDFSGDMKNRIVGLYTSSYKSASGENRQIATSKFEPTYARQAYPCFDEPNLKAKYKVHLLKPKDSSYIALSNYPVSKTEDYDDNHQLVSFDETVSMSTYLSCFIVSDFTHTETAFENNGKMIPLKVYASPQNLAKTTYAGQVGKKVIEFYIDYFKIPYPLPKLDMVAIPDFVSGAMEHWGLVTYRETALLYTNTTHSTANKQRVATVVAHELAHSWFGNLVTMDWWNDLWLNEGFASYIEYKGVNAAEPTWGMLDQFLVGDLHTVLNLDATLSSHPIVQTVLTPDQISEIFDTISYNKGASILRMLESTVGEANFQEGVKNYLNKFAYSNAVTKDFLTEIQNVVGNKLNVAELMDTFTVQMGYPILTATVSGDNYTFTQKRFLKDPKAEYNESETTYKYKWTVPVTYVTDLGKSTELSLLKHSDEELTITKPKEAKWIKFNHDQVGYYRVNYPLTQWNELISNYHSLNTADRTHLLEESFSIAEADQLSYEIPLNLTKNLEKETDYTPWSVASTKLKVILRYLRGSDSKQETAFKKYIGKICTPAYENFTWNEDNDDGHLKRLARIEVLGLACAVDQENCLTEAQNQFNNWIQSKEPLSQDLRSLVYHYGMKNANESVWESLLEIYKSESDASEKVKLVYGLASVENVTLLNRLIELAKDESIVRGQDFFTVLQYISANPQGTELVWTWVRENWEYLVGRFTLNDRYLGSLIPAITGRFASDEKITEMKAFFEKYPNAGAGKASRAKALETVQNNIRWLSRYRTVVENWVTTYSS
ncbi:aminopeptidase A isoform X1 [Leptinotarsa decemlineata]|uniref:aminopeptidase A isoform X1 n=2 Tax=Leptinotarsa decemlineata TaxID=7539 RepID=UPI003D30C1EA